VSIEKVTDDILCTKGLDKLALKLSSCPGVKSYNITEVFEMHVIFPN